MILRLNGWIRLGAALSLGWIIAITVYAAFDRHRFAVKEEGWEVAPTKTGTAQAERAVHADLNIVQHSWLTECSYPQAPGKASWCEVRAAHLSAFAFGPVVMLWLGGLAAAWIRAGFKRSPEQD